MKPYSVAPGDRGLPVRSAVDDPHRGRWYPWLFVAGFLIVIAVNGVMVTLAIDSFAGLETQHSYERGLAYNDTLAAARAQEALGWQVTYDAVPKGPAEGGGRAIELESRFLDRDGTPLSGLHVRAILLRPTVDGHDQEIPMIDKGAGRYGATTELPLAGQWDLRIVAAAQTGDTGQSWQSSRRVLLP